MSETVLTGIDPALRERVSAELRIGRIGFLNVYPMHFGLGVEPALVGTPTELNAALVDGSVDVACVSSIEYARHANELVLLPSLCIAAEGAVGSIFAIANAPLEQVREIHCTPASATSVALVEMLCRLRGGRPQLVPLTDEPGEVLREPERAVLLIGDEALRARGDAALAEHAFVDLGERWLGETGLPMVYAVWAVRREVADRDPELVRALDAMLVASVDRFAADPSAVQAAAAEYAIDPFAARAYFERICYGFGPNERKGLLRFLRTASEYGLLDAVPQPAFVGTALDARHNPGDAPAGDATTDVAQLAGGLAVDRAEAERRVRELYTQTVGTRAALDPRQEDVEQVQRCLELERQARDIDVDGVLHKALRDERIDDVEAIALLQSRRLVDVGQVAHELRLRRAPADTITFVVDRNINYTNVCVTDCGFCAFYRKPGDAHEGYLHGNETILEKIRETIDLGGTTALLQGGHNPDLDLGYYVQLFQAVKERFPTFHLHALSPPEIQHIARRSKLSVGETLAALRDAGLDSLPGGGGEVLVDRVRRIIAPKKTKADDWLGIMREAQRMGMSTTASMMYGHVELLAERVEHMRRVREVQDETRGFRAFISWTFQPGNTPLARLLELGQAPAQEHLPPTPTPFDYLLTQAVSRIYLDNVANIQSSWVTQGLKVGQSALYFGANDLGSIMIEENVVSSAGTTYRASVEDFVGAIRATGSVPVQRDTLYRTVRRYD